MEGLYWEKFTQTGKIEDYLYYRGLQTCRKVMGSYETDTGRVGEKSVESIDNSDRHCAVGTSKWRI